MLWFAYLLWLFWLCLALLGLWAFTRFYLRGESLDKFDRAPGSLTGPVDQEPSEGHYDLVEMLAEMHSRQRSGSMRSRLARLRAEADALGDDASLEDIRLVPVSIDGLPAEWVLAGDADPGRRLLYIHGGGFLVGSPRSHRAITTRLARSHGTAVLAIDYRLQPEHRRLDGLADVQKAYRWILDNGPEGQGAPHTLFVSGDSAGGNLALVAAAWARDQQLRPANAVIALSPTTDATCSAPSMRANLPTDYMLGPNFGRLMSLPNGLLLWLMWMTTRVRPCDPRLSPLRGDLAGLPPTLVHASSAEMLLDDARRYVNKALSCGSEAYLEVWPHMIHVWHLFHDRLPEAGEAFRHIERFMEMHANRGGTETCERGDR